MKKIIILFVFLFSMIFVNAQWVQTNGPNGCDATSVAAIGTNIFAVMNNEAYISNNNGTSWAQVDTSLNNHMVFSLTVNGSNIYAATYDGLFMSANNGTVWTSAGFNGLQISFIAFMGTDIYVANTSNIYKSLDNGLTWSDITNGLPTSSTLITTIAISGSNVLVGTEDFGGYISTNFGASWSVNGPFTRVSCYSSFGSDLFAADGVNAIFHSTNNGVSWTIINSGPIFTSIACDGTNVYAGTWYDGLYYSNNNGLNWTLANNGMPDVNYTSICINGSKVVVGTLEGGVFLSTDHGVNWEAVSNGFPNANVSSMAVIGSTVIAVSNGIFSSNDNGNTWDLAKTSIPYDVIYSTAVHGSKIYIGTGSEVYQSADSGSTWTVAWPLAIIHSFAFSGSKICIGKSCGIYVSTNNGSTWTYDTLGSPPNFHSNIISLAISGPNIIAGGDLDGVYISSNNGTSWALPNVGLGGMIYSLVVSGTNVFAGTSGGVFLSVNNGLNWTHMVNGMPGCNVYSIVCSGTNIFAGTDQGIYLSNNNGLNWTAMNTGLTITDIRALAICGTFIYAGTHGKGVWKRSLSDFNVSNYNFSGNVFNDINNNGINDNGEDGLPNRIVKTKIDNWLFNTDANGNYTAYSHFPSDTLSLVNISLYATVTPQIYPVTCLDTGKNFAVHYIPDVQDLRITITNLTPARPGFNDVIHITYKNVGTDTMNGYVSLGFPNNNLTYVSSIPTQSNINTNNIQWNFANLLPLEQRNISATFNVLSTTLIGTILGFGGVVYPVVGDTTPGNNHDGLEQVVIGSFDPNEKEVSPNDGFTPQQLASDEKLIFTIHFQNTGTDTAFNVIIVDTLSPNLDASTFEILSSSHPCTFSIRNAGIVEFTFPNILLPDSNVNFIGSNGFVKYAIKPNSTLLLGDSITNTAYIYFDFNLPVATNATSTLITTLTDLTDLIKSDNEIYLYPNPANTSFTIDVTAYSLINAFAEIYSIDGKLLKHFAILQKQTNINISDLASGVYFVKVSGDSSIAVKRMIKE
jgi:uncharacterized repeat protein (TIGR01451 family)